jgi:hypothetical protein
MKRIRKFRIGWRMGWKAPVLLASLALAMVACGEKPGGPLPPHAPPKPVTWGGKAFTAQFDLAARPVPPKPGPM